MMTVKTFKKMCMLADTKKADEVCEYYLTMDLNLTTVNECVRTCVFAGVN